MAAQIITAGSAARGTDTRDHEVASCPDDDELERLSGVQALAAVSIVVMAVLLVAAPALVAVVAIVNPLELTRLFEGLLGVSALFTLVAAGRVPAATILAFALTRPRREP